MARVADKYDKFKMVAQLYAALAAQSGVMIECNYPGEYRTKLYELLKELKDKDQDLESIEIKESPTNPTRDLWLVKKKGSKDAPQGN